MDVHNSDDSGSGSEMLELSNRARRKLLMQQKQQVDKQPGMASAATPTDTAPAEVPTNLDMHCADRSSDSWEHDQQPPMTGPCKVEYCPSKLSLERKDCTR